MNNETEITNEEINRYKKDSEEIHKKMPPAYCALMSFSKELRRMTQTTNNDLKGVVKKLHIIVFDSLALCFVAANTFDLRKKVLNLFNISSNIDIAYAGLHFLREHNGISLGQYGVLTGRLSKTEKQIINWLNTERRKIGLASTEHQTQVNEIS